MTGLLHDIVLMTMRGFGGPLEENFQKELFVPFGMKRRRRVQLVMNSELFSGNRLMRVVFEKVMHMTRHWVAILPVSTNLNRIKEDFRGSSPFI